MTPSSARVSELTRGTTSVRSSPVALEAALARVDESFSPGFSAELTSFSSPKRTRLLPHV